MSKPVVISFDLLKFLEASDCLIAEKREEAERENLERARKEAAEKEQARRVVLAAVEGLLAAGSSAEVAASIMPFVTLDKADDPREYRWQSPVSLALPECSPVYFTMCVDFDAGTAVSPSTFRVCDNFRISDGISGLDVYWARDNPMKREKLLEAVGLGRHYYRLAQARLAELAAERAREEEWPKAPLPL